MAEILANTYPDIFSAVGIHSGLPYCAARSVPGAFAVMRHGNKSTAPAAPLATMNSRKIIFHGKADRTVHISNGHALFERAHHQGNDAAIHVTDELSKDKSVQKSSVLNKNGQAVAEYWVVNNGSHTWFGGSNKGSYTSSRGPDASREMIRFFLQS